MTQPSSVSTRQPAAAPTTHDRRPGSDQCPSRVVIERIRPQVDSGRFPIKRTVGESVDVWADIFADGHEVVVALLCDRHLANADAGWRETPMTLVTEGSDEWTGRFEVDAIGWHQYEIVAWVDRFQSWRRDLMIRARAGQEVSVELLEGSLLIREAATRAEQRHGNATEAHWLLTQADALTESTTTASRVAVALEPHLSTVMTTYADRARAAVSPALRIWVDRERARVGAWYEMFPRSAGPDPTRSGTFREAAAQLPRIADLGFDVVYLPPIHPIGVSFRKGPNNSSVAGGADPGSPWAIGSDAGGHTSVDPGLGTLDDFKSFREEADRVGLEVALDLALQCSPDHPWVREHPEWFRHRPDGTIRSAENPPKKYQDIYPLDLECDDWRSLWQALCDVVSFWMDRGVRIFRVDNPHTKPFRFWEWLIDQAHRRDGSVIFLSEAFTRPKLMRYLAKVGFTQSYTYFTWRNTKDELTEYFTELTATDVRQYLRPNLFANTPDILHAYLQHGGPPAFEARLLLAATLGANYGIYSGFELGENQAVGPDSEEYAESEKYQYRKRDWNRGGHLQELIARVNRIRHQHRALQSDWTLHFHPTDNPHIVAYTKSSRDDTDQLMTIVNLDPHHTQHGFVEVPVAHDWYQVRDLLDDTTYNWHRGWNYVRFDPGVRQGHILWLPISRS